MLVTIILFRQAYIGRFMRLTSTQYSEASSSRRGCQGALAKVAKPGPTHVHVRHLICRLKLRMIHSMIQVSAPRPSNAARLAFARRTAKSAAPNTRASSRPHAIASANATPDLWLAPPANGAKIALFGTVHADTTDTRIGDFIVEHRPKTVVVETAINASHGESTGNTIDLDSALEAVNDPLADRQTFGMASIAARLRDAERAETPTPIQESETWQNLINSNMVYSEHLAYVAALSVGAGLMFGDRPKMVTYRRMLCCPSLADLDAAFAIQCWSNYHDLFSGTALEKTSDVLTEKILFQERDAVMLKSLHEASVNAGEGNTVVGVVGGSHVSGMEKLWDSNSWKDIATQAAQVPGPVNEDPRQFGIRRALFDAVIRLTCRDDVSMDAAMTLGPPPPEAMDAYELTSELYGTTRMLLATLPREKLEMVCSGWRCDPWEFLEPVRNVRAANGGPGYDLELIENLRTLNFELS